LLYGKLSELHFFSSEKQLVTLDSLQIQKQIEFALTIVTKGT